MMTKSSRHNRNEDHEHGPLMKYPEAAEYLGVSERKLWDLKDAGEIPCVRFCPNGAVRFSRRELDRWIDIKLAENKVQKKRRRGT